MRGGGIGSCHLIFNINLIYIFLSSFGGKIIVLINLKNVSIIHKLV